MSVEPPRELRFAVGDGELAALQWGSGEPAAVLLHGAGDNAAIWGATAKALSFPNIVALDFRGHGQTTATARFDTATLAADVEHLVRTLELPAATLIGHSWGANIAVEVAVRAAIPVSALVLVEGNVGSYREVYAGTEASPPEAWPEPPPAERLSPAAVAERAGGLDSIRGALLLRSHRAGGDAMIHPTPAEGRERAVAAWSQPLTELYRRLPP